MRRAVLGAVAGWLAMSALVMLGFTLGPLLLGLERVFEPGTYQATPLWIALAALIGLGGALAGGWIAARIGRSRGPLIALAVLVVVGTVVNEARAVRTRGVEPAARPAGQSVLDALSAAREHAREPLITRIGNPIAGLLGLWIGVQLALRRGRKARGGTGP